MTFAELVRVFDAKGRGRKRRARCPCHKSRGLTLIVSDDAEKGLSVHCFYGCSNDDVLAAVGLSWKDLKTKKEWLPPEEFKAAQARKKAEELAAAELRKSLRYWSDQTRRWETVASLLHAHLVQAREAPEGPAIARLWRKALATARARHERLTEFWPSAPDVQGYHITELMNHPWQLWPVCEDYAGHPCAPRGITRRFVGDEIAEVLGL